MKVPFLVKDAVGEVEVVYWEYGGPIPETVMRRFVRGLQRMNDKGMFYPMDVMDVYEEAFAKLEALATSVPATVKSPIGYLLRAMQFIVLKIRRRVTLPLREEYRRLEGATRPAERCDVACDQEMDAACIDEERVSYDANDLAEMLIAAPDRALSHQKACDCLNETFPKLLPETARAFRAWLAADGVMAEAAKIMHEGRTTYMRRFAARCAEFRRVCTWRWDG